METAAAGANAVGKHSMDKQQFLKLFASQLKYQNPMNPMDTNEFSTQLAQLSSMEQLINLNEGVKELNASQSFTNKATAAGFIGNQVKLTDGTESRIFGVSYEEGGPFFLLDDSRKITMRDIMETSKPGASNDDDLSVKADTGLQAPGAAIPPGGEKAAAQTHVDAAKNIASESEAENSIKKDHNNAKAGLEVARHIGVNAPNTKAVEEYKKAINNVREKRGQPIPNGITGQAMPKGLPGQGIPNSIQKGIPNGGEEPVKWQPINGGMFTDSAAASEWASQNDPTHFQRNIVDKPSPIQTGIRRR